MKIKKYFIKIYGRSFLPALLSVYFLLHLASKHKTPVATSVTSSITSKREDISQRCLRKRWQVNAVPFLQCHTVMAKFIVRGKACRVS